MPESKLKPVGVTGEAADAYLSAKGWVRDHMKDNHWLSPGSSVSFSRGQAVCFQFERDFVALAFVMQHAPPDLLVQLLPPVVLERIAELAAKHGPATPETKPN